MEPNLDCAVGAPAAFGPVTDGGLRSPTSCESKVELPCDSENIGGSVLGTLSTPCAPADAPVVPEASEAVPPPVKTGESVDEGSSKEERLRKEAVSFRHLLTHLPKSQFRPACQCGKLVKVHHRRRVPQEDGAVAFGDKCTADTLFSKDAQSQGVLVKTMPS